MPTWSAILLHRQGVGAQILVALRVIFNKQGEGLIQQAEQSELLGSVGTPCACDRVKQVFQPGICRIGLSVYPHWRVSFSASVPL